MWDLLRGNVVLDTQTIKTYIIRFTGDQTFKEIYEKYGWVLNITVTANYGSQQSSLLNYLTAPNVLVWSACVASCAIPGMYDIAELYIKTDDGKILPYHPSST